MGFRRRAAFKVLPGVRVTVGGPGCRTERRLWVRAAVPGREAERRAVLPGPLTARWERRLHHCLMVGDVDGMGEAAPQHRPLTAALGGLLAGGAGQTDRARALLQEAWGSGVAFEHEGFVRRYLGHATVCVPVVADVSALVPVSRDAVGLALVGLARAGDDLGSAVEVAEELDPSVLSALALADCYARAGRYEDVVALTRGIGNTDDPTALLLVQRAMALRALDRTAEADVAFTEAVRPVVRSPSVRSFAIAERDRGWGPTGESRT